MQLNYRFNNNKKNHGFEIKRINNKKNLNRIYKLKKTQLKEENNGVLTILVIMIAYMTFAERLARVTILRNFSPNHRKIIDAAEMIKQIQISYTCIQISNSQHRRLQLMAFEHHPPF